MADHPAVRVQARVGGVPGGQFGLRGRVAAVGREQQRGHLVDQPVIGVGSRAGHGAPGVPEQQLVALAVGQLGQHALVREPRAALRTVGAHAVAVDVESAATVPGPDVGGTLEAGTRDVERVEVAVLAGLQHRVGPPPAVAVVVFHDHVVVVEVGREVRGEADPAARRYPAPAQRGDGQQGEVTAAADDPAGLRARGGQRSGEPALVGGEHAVQPAVVDLGQPVAGEREPVRPVVHDHVADHGGQLGEIGRQVGRQRVQQRAVRARVAVPRLTGVLLQGRHGQAA